MTDHAHPSRQASRHYVTNLNAARGAGQDATETIEALFGIFDGSGGQAQRPCATTAAATTITRMFWEIMDSGRRRRANGRARGRDLRHVRLADELASQVNDAA